MSGGGVRFELEQLPAHLREQARAKIEEQKPVRLADLKPRDVLLCPDDCPSTPVEKARAKASRNKYSAIRVDKGGKRFDSRHEYEEYLKLLDRQRRGEISDLRRQVKFSLFDPGGECRGEHIATYTADFVYKERGELRVADAKSKFTKKMRDWPRTKKLMRACHGIEVIEL